MHFKAFLIAPCFHFSLVSGATQKILGHELPASPLDERFSEMVVTAMEKWHVPGIAVAVVNGNETYSKGFGIASYPSEPVTPSTLFYTGSTTKAFTAAAMSLLVDDASPEYAHVKWSTPVSELIRDDFVLENDYATTHITIEDALSHRTGMPRHDLSIGGPNSTVRDVVRSMRYLPLTEQPRTTFQYCNIMFIAISHAIETLTSKWLGDFIRDRIWEPLNMQSSFFSLKDALRASSNRNSNTKLAHGYMWDNDTGAYMDVDWPDFPSVSGAGSIISNVLDYSLWIRSLIDRNGPVSLSGHTAIASAHSIPVPAAGPPGALVQPFTGPVMYGFGWIITVYRGERVIMHDGGINGFGANVVYLPDRKFGLVALGNTLGTSNIIENQIAFHLMDEFLETPEEERLDWDELSEKTIALQKALLASTRQSLYPSTPTPPLPPSLPLANYTGTYHHPAYQNLTLALSPSSTTIKTSTHLHAIATANIVPYTLTLAHISGDFFLANLTVPSLSPEPVMAVRAEFHLDAAGAVAEFGVELEPAMGEGKLWFQRLL